MINFHDADFFSREKNTSWGGNKERESKDKRKQTTKGQAPGRGEDTTNNKPLPGSATTTKKYTRDKVFATHKQCQSDQCSICPTDRL